MSVYDKMSESQQFACRVIADHARSTAFAIADGILPGNEGRNYVLRKIMRRAIYHGREHLNLTEPFFYKVCDFVVDKMHGAFPELETQREFIGKIVRLEEQRFANTVTTGIQKFNQETLPNITKTLVPFAENLKKINNEIGLRIQKSIAPLAQQLAESNKLMSELVAKSLIPINESIAKIQADINKSALTGFVEAHAEMMSKLKPSIEKFFKAAMSNPEFQKLQEDFHQIGIIIDKTDTESENGKDLLFAELAKLYDTFGTPRDLIRLALEEYGAAFSEDEFNNRFEISLQEIQKQSSIGQTQRKSEISPLYAQILEKVGANTFHGYDATQYDDSKVVAILDGEKQLDSLEAGSQGSVVLDQTPFYAEAGGQVGDVGKLISTDTAVSVADTYSPVTGLIIHKVTVDKGSIKVGDIVTATVDAEKRDATRRNHTATHLVHAALREVLGTHVKQAGSVVAPSYLRFDFTHYQPMTDGELSEIEDLVNRYILQNEPVTTNMMALEDAMRSGAVAMFGEKYGSEVRVLSVGDGAFSRELCGGTHVRATGDIGSFKITSDEAIASGVRRIRAITGFDAFERFREDERLIDASLNALNTQRDNLPNAIAKLADELKKTRKEMDDLKLKIATGSIGEASSNGDEARDIAGVKVLAKQVDGLDANGTRQLSDTLLARLKSGVVILGRETESKVSIIVRVSDDLTDKIKAGNVIKEIVPIVGGRGGGKADMAEGGGSEPDKLSDAIDASYHVIEKMLK